MNNRNKQYGRVTIGAADSVSVALHSSAPASRNELLNNLVRAAAEYVRGVRARWEQRQRVRATYLALRALDASTLRDLGFHRSEILSVATEIGGATGSSRMRIVAHAGH